MLLLIVLLSLFSLTWGQSTSPVVDPDKFTICAITINSDDEKKVFQAQAAKDPKKFNPVVELTNMGDSNDWFSKACSSGIRCDQLVISGHFGGDFFGESGKSLSLRELETAGCSKSCEGILSKPYEVFLFGCNTLSGKEGDSRTPAQYLQVLLIDGIPLAQAELVVQSRYGAIGDSHKASMQRAFGGESKQLYGFDSVGPSGKNVKGFLNNYFTKVSAANQLEKQQAKRMLDKVDMANKALAESLKSTAFSQCASVNLNDEKSQKVCGLLDSRKSKGQKLDLTIELLGQEDYLLYLPAINTFMKDIQYESLSEEDKKTFDLIKNNTVIKQQLLGLIDQTHGLGLKAEWILLAHNKGYLSDKETSQKITFEIEKIFSKRLSMTDSDRICSLFGDISPYIKISDKNLISRYIGPEEIQAFSCLVPISDPLLAQRIISTKVSASDVNTIETQISIASNSTERDLQIPTILINHAKKKFSDSDVYEAGSALEFIVKFHPDDPDALALARKFINDPKQDNEKIRYGLRALSEMKTKDLPALLDVLGLAKKLDHPANDVINVLINSKSEDKKIQVGISDLLNLTNVQDYNKEKIISHFKDLKPEDNNIHQNLVKYATETNSYFGKRDALELLKTLNLSPELKAEVEKLN